MIRRLLPAALGFGLCALLFLSLPGGDALSQEIRRVLVTNFPDPQRVEGRVSIEAPLPMSEAVRFTNVTVSPVRPDETTRLVEAGTLEASGYSEVVLSLEGQVRGEVARAGEVGAILIPDEELVRLAFDEQGRIHFALRATAPEVNTRTPYFASDQPSYRLGFPRYRVFLYNTTDKTVRVDVYAYLTN